MAETTGIGVLVYSVHTEAVVKQRFERFQILIMNGSE
jgi:hypothetical protein